MPLYEYRCEDCDSLFEVLQRLNEDPLKICPKCGGQLKKLISQSAIQFKGSGWYITDYARRQPSDGQPGQGNGLDKKDRQGSKDKGATNSSPSQADSKK
ncbi:MAG: zinc ribbon domain-containing protein [Candidatus Aminicenantes bacterium]|nr:zinc ribbon domain-containing protein [Candidatus Aminicenantes bacterium]